VLPTVPALQASASPVNPLSNYFNAVSAAVLALVAGLVIDKVLEPRLERYDVPRDELEPEVHRAGGTRVPRT